ncbi:Inner membrane ABC transporter permease protein YnjC [Aliiroseovarius sp. xm-m-379]|uniref:ABC transporter permease n=1 Tax=unclassified Aliiroseovarius TaxID=2623558 RepID=UPI001569B71A|nr:MULTISPECIES: ABC transporter permease subunit [unclassified Aliiroseovarius]NRP23444.1 Inner membrane ABC transporter permease protein YnjC [Aliiroseovarius sp. xm-m-379]NRP32243.1 Inner membrane ABC transporter permease protein YnjC [Aliiroseovarius sp. xm-a-104]NRQ19363.1 Inner membrane ABC transporter permease protein YnjC [Aliiroseovarius sp. xm-v-204]
MSNRASLLSVLPGLTLLVLLGPVFAGLYGVVLPALGHLPAAGYVGPSSEPFRDLLTWPGLGASVRLSLTTGFAAAALSLLIVALILAGWSGTRWFAWVERALSPLLSVPHAAAAFGFAFLIAPSGWVFRLISPGLTGWVRPPDLLILQDPVGLSLIAGMVMKEVPFLLLMSIAALGQVAGGRRLIVAQSLGYGRVAGWLIAVFPAIYQRIRLPVLVVLAWSMSVVDVAVILGPSTPSTLSVQIVRWMSDPDLVFRLRAAAGALLQFGLVLGGLALWWGLERALAGLCGRLVARGVRFEADGAARGGGLFLAFSVVLWLILGLLGMLVWSFAGFWTFPDLLPDQFTLRSWQRHATGSLNATLETALIAGIVVSLGLFLTIGCLEAEERQGKRLSSRGMWLLYLPLLVPQTAFLPGLQTLMLSFGIETGRAGVLLAHLVFVLPYMRLSLQDPWRQWDQRQALVAASLGASANRVLWQIRLPMLLGPVLTALAVGVAVSVGQYLPTLLMGGGRVETLTTEALALSSGGDRRAIGVFALLQTVVALAPFALALLVPALVWRNRSGLQHEG